MTFELSVSPHSPGSPRTTDALQTSTTCPHAHSPILIFHPFCSSAVVAKPTLRASRKAVVVRAEANATNWIKKNPTVLMASAAGWFVLTSTVVRAP